MTAEDVFAAGTLEGQYIYVTNILYQQVRAEHPERNEIQLWRRQVDLTSGNDVITQYLVVPQTYRETEPYLRLPEGM